MRMTDRRLVLMALDAAIQWETDLRDGSPDEDAAESQNIIDGYRKVLERISGGKLAVSELAMNKHLEGTRLVGLDELRRMASSGFLENHADTKEPK